MEGSRQPISPFDMYVLCFCFATLLFHVVLFVSLFDSIVYHPKKCLLLFMADFSNPCLLSRSFVEVHSFKVIFH